MDTAFVYCLDFANGKKYVGVSSRPDQRYKEHKASDTACGRAFRKHGAPKMTLLIKASRAYCMDLEAKLTDLWGTLLPNGYNQQRGGLGGSVPCAKSREKMRQAQIGTSKPAEVRLRMSLSQQSRPPATDEARARMSEAARRRGVAKQTLEAAAAANRRPHSEERKQAQSLRMSDWWKQRKQQGAVS